MSSGSQVLTAVRAGIEADILASDYLMSGITGGQLVYELRADCVRIPTLLLTVYAAADEDVPAEVPYLTKPFRPVDLAARVDELLRRWDNAEFLLKAVD